MKKVLTLLAGILLAAANLYAGNGDLIVNGSLGVGTTTPSTKLHIAGSGSVVSVGNLGTEMRLENAATIGDVGSGSGFASNGSGASIGAWSNPITFYVGNNGSTKLERMRITESGNVGIGTTAPGGVLDVRDATTGLIGFSTSIDTFGEVYISSGNTINGRYDLNANSELWLNYVGYQGGTTQFRDLQIGNGKGAAIAFFDGSSGNVGIGTTSLDPAYRLTINGKGLASGGIWENSDIKLKKDILPVEGALDKVLKLNGVSYEWKRDKDFEGETLEALTTDEDGKIKDDKYRDLPEGRTLGVIAQELENVLPEAVNTGEDGIKAVSYTKIIPVLIEAMKEQQKQITDQQKEITKQQKEIEKMKDMISKSK